MILITQPRAGTSHNEIIALQMAARDKGWDVLSAPGGWRLDEELTKSGVKGVPYGSQTFCEVIAQQMNWQLKQNSFDWLAKLPEVYLKRKVEFMTMAEARKITERKFIKPADDKCFPAKVYEAGEFKPHEIIEDNYPVLVSDPVEFDLEYRTFVGSIAVKTWYNADYHEATAKAWSNYIFYDHIADPKYWNMVPADEEWLPREFVENLLYDLWCEKIETVPSVIDVGRIKGKGWAIIETNQAWASGIYGCDPGRVLDVLEESCAPY